MCRKKLPNYKRAHCKPFEVQFGKRSPNTGALAAGSLFATMEPGAQEVPLGEDATKNIDAPYRASRM